MAGRKVQLILMLLFSFMVVTTDAAADGYWLTTASDANDQPVPFAGTLQVDLPLQEQRSFYLGVVPSVALCGSTVSAQVSGSIANLVSLSREVRTATQRQTPGDEWSRLTPAAYPQSTGPQDSVILAPLDGPLNRCLDTTPIALDATGTKTRPAEYRLWLRFISYGTAGTYTGTLTLNIHGAVTSVPLQLTVWPVTVPKSRPFDVYGYGDLITYAGGEQVTSEHTIAVMKKLDAYAAAGGNVIGFSGSNSSAAYLKYGPSHLPLPVKQPYSLDALPSLDFSYYDTWFDLVRGKLKRVEPYVDLLPATLANSGFPLTLLENPPAAGTPEHKKVLRWWLSELKAYLERRGFSEEDGFFCKVSDEIPPEDIPAYLETAEVVRQAGWRPATTFIPPMSRSSEWLNQMQPQTDMWRMSIAVRDTFRKLTTEKYRLEWKQVTHTSGWAQYTNAGALDTWAHGAIYGTDAAGNANEPAVDRTLVLQSTEAGIPLSLRPGESPWANTAFNVAFILSSTLYAARADGLGPTANELHARYSQRTSTAPDAPIETLNDRRVWHDVPAAFLGNYTNGGARDTGAWSMAPFDYEANKARLDKFQVLQTLSAAGAPLQYAGLSPWGNQKRGVYYRQGGWVWVSLYDGREPGALLTVRYSKLDANGNRVWHDAPLSTIGQYTNGGAIETWGVPLPADAAAADVDQLLILQNVSASGLPLDQLGVSPWGNRRLGVSFVFGTYAWVATRDGSSPNGGTTITVRYKERILDPVNGSVLVPPDPTDQTWFYSGISNTFAMPYEMLASYPLLAAIEKPHGYGMFAFDWWNEQRIIWADGPAAMVSTGPAYTGMRDGWRDAQLIEYAVRTQPVIALSDLASKSSTSLLPLRDVSVGDPGETYTDFSGLTQTRLNSARRELLRRLSQ